MRENVCRAELHNTWNRLLQFVITFYQFYLIEISQVNWLRIFLGEIKYIRLTSVDRRPACFETIHRNCWYHQAKHESWQRWMLSFTNLRNVKRDTKNVKLGYKTFWTACQRTGNEDSNFLYCNVKRWLHFLSIMIKICEHERGPGPFFQITIDSQAVMLKFCSFYGILFTYMYVSCCSFPSAERFLLC